MATALWPTDGELLGVGTVRVAACDATCWVARILSGDRLSVKGGEWDPAREKRLFHRRRSGRPRRGRVQSFLPSREMWPQGRAVTRVGEDRPARLPGLCSTCQGVASGTLTCTDSPGVSLRQSAVPVQRVGLGLTEGVPGARGADAACVGATSRSSALWEELCGGTP